MAYALSAEEVRVLGALIEKETATPDYYPLTLNALVNACNQKSNRDPVVAYGERDVIRAINHLRDRGWCSEVHLSDSRVPKYEHDLTRALNLTLQERAALCVLLLRGPQTVGEIRGRTNRLYPFESLEEVEIALDELASREEPLVLKLPLQPGRKEARYAHLLAGEPDIVEPVQRVIASPAQNLSESDQEKRINQLEAEVTALKETLAALREEFADFRSQFE
jgi:hypothetical protein